MIFLPKNCRECPLANDEWTCAACGELIHPYCYVDKPLPDFCPLREDVVIVCSSTMPIDKIEHLYGKIVLAMVKKEQENPSP